MFNRPEDAFPTNIFSLYKPSVNVDIHIWWFVYTSQVTVVRLPQIIFNYNLHTITNDSIIIFLQLQIIHERSCAVLVKSRGAISPNLRIAQISNFSVISLYVLTFNVIWFPHHILTGCVIWHFVPTVRSVLSSVILDDCDSRRNY